MAAALGIFKKEHVVTEAERDLLLNIVRESGLLRELSGQQIRNLAPACRFETFNTGEITCHCPDASHDAFILVKGMVAVTRKHKEDEHVVELAMKGAVVNVCILMGSEFCYIGARAVGEAQVVALDSRMLLGIFDKDPRLGYLFMRSVGHMMSEQTAQHLDHLLHPEAEPIG